MSDAVFITQAQAMGFLCRLLSEEQFAGKLDDTTLDAFEGMRDRERPLSEKQLLWVQGKSVQLGLVEEPAANEWSRRTLQERERIRGREVPTPVILLNKPLRPPHRMGELKK